MNERIKELLIKAIVTNYRGPMLGDVTTVDQEKFAELIVRECASLLEEEAESNHDDGSDTYNLLLRKANWMKKYFGVE